MASIHDGLLSQEFADLFGISKDTLLYYDKIGLFSPALIAENGYRVYSLDQVHTFDLLLTLRDSQLPLKEMKTYLYSRSPEEMLKVLQERTTAMKKKLADLEILTSRLDFTAKQLELGLQSIKDEPEIQELEEDRYLAFYITEEVSKDRKLRMTAAREFFKVCRENNIPSDYLRCAIISKKHLLKGWFDKDYICVHTTAEAHPEFKNPIMLTRPKGTYATVYHYGSSKNIESSYRTLIAFIEDQGFKICGNAYETELLGYLTEQDDNRYITRIAIAVEQ